MSEIISVYEDEFIEYMNKYFKYNNRDEAGYIIHESSLPTTLYNIIYWLSLKDNIKGIIVNIHCSRVRIFGLVLKIHINRENSSIFITLDYIEHFEFGPCKIIMNNNYTREKQIEKIKSIVGKFDPYSTVAEIQRNVDPYLLNHLTKKSQVLHYVNYLNILKTKLSFDYNIQVEISAERISYNFGDTLLQPFSTRIKAAFENIKEVKSIEISPGEVILCHSKQCGIVIKNIEIIKELIRSSDTIITIQVEGIIVPLNYYYNNFC